MQSVQSFINLKKLVKTKPFALSKSQGKVITGEGTLRSPCRHKEITFRSLENYSPDVYKGTLERVSFPNYENFDNPDVDCSDFITSLDCVINAVAPFKTVRIKNNASEWFDGEITEKIHTRDKLYQKFKSTKLHVDEEIKRCETQFKI